MSCMQHTHRMAVGTKCTLASMFSLWEFQSVAEPIQLGLSSGEPVTYLLGFGAPRPGLSIGCLPYLT